MYVGSLFTLSASATVQNDCIMKGRDLETLPRTVLQELLLTSISLSRTFCLRSLITNWPIKQLVLQNVSGMDGPKAALLADCLQRTKHDLQHVDIRGCNIGESNDNCECPSTTLHRAFTPNVLWCEGKYLSNWLQHLIASLSPILAWGRSLKLSSCIWVISGFVAVTGFYIMAWCLLRPTSCYMPLRQNLPAMGDGGAQVQGRCRIQMWLFCLL